MAGYNKILMMGNLTDEPDLKYTPGGTGIATFTVAVNRKWKGNDGEVKEEVDFIDCKAFGNVAETISNHLGKGEPIFVEGRLTIERWEKEGEKKSRARVVVEKFQFIGSKPKSKGGNPADDENIPY